MGVLNNRTALRHNGYAAVTFPLSDHLKDFFYPARKMSALQGIKWFPEHVQEFISCFVCCYKRKWKQQSGLHLWVGIPESIL